jgi:hypothetical protein
MADEDFQKEPPRQEARSETRLSGDDDNRFRRPDPVRNRMALIAFWLGVLCLIPPVLFAYAFFKSLAFHDRYGQDPFSVWAAWALGLAWVLGPAALIFGILGVGYRNRRPTAGGLGYAIFGIVLGTLLYLLNSSFILFDLSMVAIFG